MRHRLRDRPKAAACSARSRRRDRRSRAAAPKETSSAGEWGAACEGAILSGLDELLCVEESATWWKEDERPEDASLSELLQELVSSDDYNGAPHTALSELRPNGQREAAPTTSAVPSDNSPAARGRNTSSKNALAARLNRLRKKEYVSGLECQVTRLSDENARLERERRALGARVRELEGEARYLRAVLANDSALSQLLGRLTGVGGVKLSTSLFREPREQADDHDYALPGLVTTTDHEEEGEAAPSAGVCLHVDKDKVSVEFCQACARSAASSAKM